VTAIPQANALGLAQIVDAIGGATTQRAGSIAWSTTALTVIVSTGSVWAAAGSAGPLPTSLGVIMAGNSLNLIP
jgi:hypothetical protein